MRCWVSSSRTEGAGLLVVALAGLVGGAAGLVQLAGLLLGRPAAGLDGLLEILHSLGGIAPRLAGAGGALLHALVLGLQGLQLAALLLVRLAGLLGGGGGLLGGPALGLHALGAVVVGAAQALGLAHRLVHGLLGFTDLAAGLLQGIDQLALLAERGHRLVELLDIRRGGGGIRAHLVDLG